MSATTERGSASLVRSITIAALVIAIVNGLDQTIFAVLTQHVTPITVFQYFASALLGLAAFAGGYTTALLGLLIHVVVSFIVAAIFILAASKIALLRRTVFVSAAGIWGRSRFHKRSRIAFHRSAEVGAYPSGYDSWSRCGRLVHWAAPRLCGLAGQPRAQG